MALKRTRRPRSMVWESARHMPKGWRHTDGTSLFSLDANHVCCWTPSSLFVSTRRLYMSRCTADCYQLIGDTQKCYRACAGACELQHCNDRRQRWRLLPARPQASGSKTALAQTSNNRHYSSDKLSLPLCPSCGYRPNSETLMHATTMHS